MRRITSSPLASSPSISNSARICWLIGIDLADRSKMPPPG
jgi:hypothetical protein